jgi:phosphomannomutase
VLKISVSGIRGVWGESLNHRTILKAIEAFVTVKGTHKKIALATDTRNTATSFKLMVSSILLSYGYNVIDLGVSATPLVLFAVRHMDLDGGIVLTASHNSIEWNALKFIKKGGFFFNKKDMKKIEDLMKNGTQLNYSYKTIGTLQSYSYLLPYYLDFIAPFFNILNIRKRKFKIVADAVNGVASFFLPKLFEFLNIDGHIIFAETESPFERNPEPVPHNLTKLQDSVMQHKADLGIAFDPDGDRLGLVDNKGQAIDPHWTLVLAYKNFIEAQKNSNLNIAVNFSTTMLISNIAKENNAKVFKTAIGEINVIDTMVENHLEIGGEGNGGVIFPKINYCRDAIVAVCFVLDYLTFKKESLSNVIEEIKSPTFVSQTLPSTFEIDKEALQKTTIKFLESSGYTKMTSDTTDGLYIDYTEGWVQIRFSNTEPLIRIMGESYNKENQEILIEKIKTLITSSQ